MKRIELIDTLCWDDDGDGSSFYPLECLYDLEGLSYPELMALRRRLYDSKGAKRAGGVPLPIPGRGGARRRLAEALGADEEQSAELASGAAKGLDLLARAMKRFGLPVPQRGREELLRVATAIYSAYPTGEAAGAVNRAELLIAAVDARVAGKAVKA